MTVTVTSELGWTLEITHLHFITKKIGAWEMKRFAHGLGLFLKFPVLTRMNTLTEVQVLLLLRESSCA